MEMEIFFIVLAGIGLFVFGYVVGEISTVKQWSRIIETYKQIIKDWERMYNDMSEEFIKEIRSHGDTFIEFQKKIEEYERILNSRS